MNDFYVVVFEVSFFVLTVKNSGVTCEVSSILKIVGIELSFRLILL